MLKKILAVLGAVSSTLENLQYAWEDKVYDIMTWATSKFPKNELVLDYETPEGQQYYLDNGGTHGTTCTSFWGRQRRWFDWVYPVVLVLMEGCVIWFLVAMAQDLGGLPLPRLQDLPIVIPIVAIIVAVFGTLFFAIKTSPWTVCRTNVRVIMSEESEPIEA